MCAKVAKTPHHIIVVVVTYVHCERSCYCALEAAKTKRVELGEVLYMIPQCSELNGQHDYHECACATSLTFTHGFFVRGSLLEVSETLWPRKCL